MKYNDPHKPKTIIMPEAAQRLIDKQWALRHEVSSLTEQIEAIICGLPFEDSNLACPVYGLCHLERHHKGDCETVIRYIPRAKRR